MHHIKGLHQCITNVYLYLNNWDTLKMEGNKIKFDYECCMEIRAPEILYIQCSPTLAA